MLLFILCGWYGSWCDYVVLCTFDVAVMFLCCVSIDFMLIGVCGFVFFYFFFFTQKTAYEWRISDGSSDVCSSDLLRRVGRQHQLAMLDALLAGVIVDEAGALVRDFDARTIGCRRRRAATGGTAYRLHRKMETRHRRALPCHAGAWRGR